MEEVPLRVAAHRYDHVRALFNGDVKIEGVKASFSSAKIVSDIFKGMIVNHAYDVSELGWTYYLRTLDFDKPPFIAIPVFPARLFRHSAVFINRVSGITRPEDLVGKTIGEFATYGHDAGVWPKGILSDEFGITPDQSRWVIGGLDFPMAPIDFIPFIRPDGVAISRAPKGRQLGEMLEKGDIDALISADVPECVLNGSPAVGRLFEDYEAVERDYHRRTGIFPIMHTVVVRRDLADERPELVRAVYHAFCKSKAVAVERYRGGRAFNHMDIMIPWFSHLFERDRADFAEDWWPYGVKANRTSIDTFLRYHYEQGLSQRRLTIEDVFHPSVLDS